jgi:hypothetical protein
MRARSLLARAAAAGRRAPLSRCGLLLHPTPAATAAPTASSTASFLKMNYLKKQKQVIRTVPFFDFKLFQIDLGLSTIRIPCNWVIPYSFFLLYRDSFEISRSMHHNGTKPQRLLIQKLPFIFLYQEVLPYLSSFLRHLQYFLLFQN